MPNKITPRALTIKEFAETYKISKSLTYVLLKQGRLTSIKIAGRRLISVDAAEALISGAC